MDSIGIVRHNDNRFAADRALDAFVTAYRAPVSAIVTAGDYPCRDLVHTEEHGWNVCGTRKVGSWGNCPNETNHGRPVLVAKTLDEIVPGDRVRFYHGASNRDQWATVLQWTVARAYEDGAAIEWRAVLHMDRLDLGNGFSAGIKVQRHVFGRYDSCGIKYACTPGVYQ